MQVCTWDKGDAFTDNCAVTTTVKFACATSASGRANHLIDVFTTSSFYQSHIKTTKSTANASAVEDNTC